MGDNEPSRRSDCCRSGGGGGGNGPRFGGVCTDLLLGGVPGGNGNGTASKVSLRRGIWPDRVVSGFARAVFRSGVTISTLIAHAFCMTRAALSASLPRRLRSASSTIRRAMARQSCSTSPCRMSGRELPGVLRNKRSVKRDPTCAARLSKLAMAQRSPMR